MAIADNVAQTRQLYFGLMSSGLPNAAAGLALDALLECAAKQSIPLRALLVSMLDGAIIDDLLTQFICGARFRAEVLIPFLRDGDDLRFGGARQSPGG